MVQSGDFILFGSSPFLIDKYGSLKNRIFKDGEKGPGWPTEGELANVSFEEYENDGHNARQCPECGCIEV